MGFKMFTVVEAISKAFRENADKQSGQISVTLVTPLGVAIKATVQEENRSGSDATGSDGATGRILTLQNSSESGDPFSVWVDDQIIAVADYTVSHLSASSTITFDNINLFDAQTIRVRYYI